MPSSILAMAATFCEVAHLVASVPLRSVLLSNNRVSRECFQSYSPTD